MGLRKQNFRNINEIDDNELHFWIGVRKNEFNVILNETLSLQNRSKRPATVPVMYLTNLRTCEPDEVHIYQEHVTSKHLGNV